ncbi:FCD domain-containing protein [Streptomyces gilvus]|uniref:FCD domain-containing protein n=1 Tax=Streptomyces gilvus TaxID=2920937 RepID=UPI001F0D42FB|nr:FCD domain-containing protein [Streptomyces sp. CME 23]MCH5675624.1 FCD domain-containing protein [Streptomyces sp. CME 23]
MCSRSPSRGSSNLSSLHCAGRKVLVAHHRIVDLVEARDAETARQVWRKHLTEARDYLVRGGITTVLDLMG